MATTHKPSVAALIVAGGRGVRVGGSVPKQYRLLAGKTVLARAIQPFLDSNSIGSVTVVIGADDKHAFERSVELHEKLRSPVVGGETRQDSVRNGLESIEGERPDLVLIHDGARPFVSHSVIEAVIEGLKGAPCALPATPMSDTLKRSNLDGTVAETVPRDRMYAAQTPQGFLFSEILQAHRSYVSASFTDDAAIAEAAGMAVRLVDGHSGNTKITSEQDIADAERRFAGSMLTRVGSGYDVHALGPGDHVILGGVRIPHDASLIGHSDADVVLHAITDAILGAIAEGDIGDHFPPSDPAFKNASSDRFLRDAITRMQSRGGVLDHVDATIIAEAPKIGPHRDAMRARIAEICGLSLSAVSIKATTNERLGALGRGEGIAALATATLRFPE